MTVIKKIAVFGICGKMGVDITRQLLKEKDIKVVCGLDIINAGNDFGTLYAGGPAGIEIFNNFKDIRKLNPDLILDFTNAESAFNSIIWAVRNKIDIIVGTTGITKEKLSAVESELKEGSSKVFIVPNFAIGAVIMMKMSAAVAKYFENCEIIEMHHDRKKDAPSGTSLLTAEYIAQKKKMNDSRLKDGESETVSGSRGAFYEGINIHSLRLPGYLASQEVVFGTTGQTLKIRHDSIDRLSFYPGVVLAIRKIDNLSNFTVGLDKILDF